VYFSVEDTDAAVAAAISLGGRVEVPPTETPHGRMSLLHGRAGELFGVLQADDLPRPVTDAA
jgi:predicted enzyme related to lactoylglutathione lyase